MTTDTTPNTQSPHRDHPIVEHLLDAYGDGLQGVMRYDRTEYDLLFLREDLRELYDRDAVSEVFEEAVLESIGANRQEDVFTFGELTYVIRGFEKATVVQVFAGNHEGIIFSTDDTVGLDVESVIRGLI